MLFQDKTQAKFFLLNRPPQVKTKGLNKESGLKGQTTTVSLGTSIHPRDDRVNGGERWWLRGAMSKKIAEEIIALLKDLSQVNKMIGYSLGNQVKM